MPFVWGPVKPEVTSSILVTIATNNIKGFTALKNAVILKKLRADVKYYKEPKWDHIAEVYYEAESDEFGWEKAIIFINEIQLLLRLQGISSGFFFLEAVDKSDFLNKNHKQ